MSRSTRVMMSPAERAERKAARVPASVKRRARRTATRQAFIARHLAETVGA